MTSRRWVSDTVQFTQANGLEGQFQFDIIPGKGHKMTDLLPDTQEALISS